MEIWLKAKNKKENKEMNDKYRLTIWEGFEKYKSAVVLFKKGA
jgi:hypothetical protein